MAIILMDGFDYDTTLRSSRYNAITGSPTLSTVQKKMGVQSLLVNTAEYLEHSIGTQDGNILIIGFHVYYTSLPASSNSTLGWLADSATGAQIWLNVKTDGTMHLSLGAGDSAVGTATSKLMLNTWHHVEWKIKVANSIAANECILKLDGVEEINAAATTDTQFRSTNEVVSFVLGNFNGNVTYYIDNFYLLDTTGSHTNTFLGPSAGIETIRPNGNGNYNDFVGSDTNSTDNYLHVDDSTADDDSSYTEASVATDKDSYAYGNLTESIDSVSGIQVHTRAKKDGGTEAREMKNFVRVSSTDYEGGGTENLADGTYKNFVDIWDDNPNAASTWTETTVNALESGVKIES